MVSRTRNKKLDYHRSREYRDTESNHRDRRRQSPGVRERNERKSEDRYYSSRRRDYDSLTKDNRDDRQNRRHDAEKDKRADRSETSRKDVDMESAKDSESKEKRKKEKKIKSVVKSSNDTLNNGVSSTDNNACNDFEDHVVLHNQETFEDCISNLEQVLVKSDAHINDDT